MMMPRFWSRKALAALGDRRLVVVLLAGGNDALNTLIPYTDPRYYELRPNLGLKDSELKDSLSRSTIISDRFALHPSLPEIKDLYDQRRVAMVVGVGSPKSDLSHFSMMDQWHTGDPENQKRSGWLGSYIEQNLADSTGFPGIGLRTFFGAKTLRSDSVAVPNVTDFATYGLQVDASNPTERPDIMRAFEGMYNRSFPQNSPLEQAGRFGKSAVAGAIQIQTATASYSSSVTYPNTNIGQALRMVAMVATTMPVPLFYVEMGGFDTHASQIGTADNRKDRLTGTHANLLSQFSQAMKAFQSDVEEHGMADSVVTMQWSEFGRRCQENASRGSDHGNAGLMFIVGNPVQGGIYGDFPSLAADDLDEGGNQKVTLDFRAAYSTILERWLDADPEPVLGSRFENVGFLG
jgi:uncharacterized protein (DUF1501 family)